MQAAKQMEQNVVFKSDYLLITFDPHTEILYNKWLPKVLDLDLDDFFKALEQYRNAIALTRPKAILVYGKDAAYPVTEEIMQWIADNVTPLLNEIGVRKIAYVYPADYLTKIGLEQLLQTLIRRGPQIERVGFDDLDKAIEWLKRV